MFCILYFTFLFISPWAKSLEKLQVVKEPWPEMLFSPQLLLHTVDLSASHLEKHS